MTNPEKIKCFLRSRKPQTFCNQCIADLVKLGNPTFGPNGNQYNPHIAQQNTNAFSRAEFPRSVRRCSNCRAIHKFATSAA
jgi:hypothetical protein